MDAQVGDGPLRGQMVRGTSHMGIMWHIWTIYYIWYLVWYMYLLIYCYFSISYSILPRTQMTSVLIKKALFWREKSPRAGDKQFPAKRTVDIHNLKWQKAKREILYEWVSISKLHWYTSSRSWSDTLFFWMTFWSSSFLAYRRMNLLGNLFWCVQDGVSSCWRQSCCINFVGKFAQDQRRSHKV